MKLLILLTLTALSVAHPQISDAGHKAVDLTYQEKNNMFELGAAVGDRIFNRKPCVKSFGCHKGYCWAGCGNPDDRWTWGDNWCYTTKSYSQSYSYVGCTHDSQCDACWKCAGPCSA